MVLNKEVRIAVFLILIILSIVFVDTYFLKPDQNDFNQLSGFQIGPPGPGNIPPNILNNFNSLSHNTKKGLLYLTRWANNNPKHWCGLYRKGESGLTEILREIPRNGGTELGILKEVVKWFMEVLCTKFPPPPTFRTRVWDGIRRATTRYVKPVATAVGRGVATVAGAAVSTEVLICAAAATGVAIGIGVPVIIIRMELSSNEALNAFWNGYEQAAQNGVEAAFTLAIHNIHGASVNQINTVLQTMLANPQLFANQYYSYINNLFNPLTSPTGSPYNVRTMGDFQRSIAPSTPSPPLCPSAVMIFDFSPHHIPQPNAMKRLNIVAGNGYVGTAYLNFNPPVPYAPSSTQFGQDFIVDFSDFCAQHPGFNGQITLTVSGSIASLCPSADFNINLNCNNPFSNTPTGTGPTSGPGGFSVDPTSPPSAPIPYVPPTNPPPSNNKVCGSGGTFNPATQTCQSPGTCTAANQECNIATCTCKEKAITPTGQVVVTRSNAMDEFSTSNQIFVNQPVFLPKLDYIDVNTNNNEAYVKFTDNNNPFLTETLVYTFVYNLDGRIKGMYDEHNNPITLWNYNNLKQLISVAHPSYNMITTFTYAPNNLDHPVSAVTYTGTKKTEERIFRAYPHPEDHEIDVVEADTIYTIEKSRDRDDRSKLKEVYYAKKNNNQNIPSNYKARFETSYIKFYNDPIPRIDSVKIFENDVYKELTKYDYANDGKLLRMRVYDQNNQLTLFEQYTYTNDNQPPYMEQRPAYIFLPQSYSWEYILYSGGLYMQYPWASLMYDVVYNSPTGPSVALIDWFMEPSLIPF